MPCQPDLSAATARSTMPAGSPMLGRHTPNSMAPSYRSVPTSLRGAWVRHRGHLADILRLVSRGMGEPIRVVWDETLTGYNFGRGHPLNPVRLDLTIRLATALGVLDGANVQIASPPKADDDLLATFHTHDYLAAVRRCAENPARYELAHGLGTDDNPCFPAMHEASARVVGGTVDLVRAVWDGRAQHGVNITGGLHHAMAGHASGFCVYNDLVVGIQTLLDAGAERVAYVDVDVHHGDGVQAAFYDDPRVLTISLHETPRTLFPGTGYPE